MADRPGELFYIMGPSGSGKDTLIRCARARVPPEAPVRFAHRYITRQVDPEGENHIAVTDNEFDRLLRHDCFAMHWASNGLRYGIGTEIYYWLEDGLSVVVNGSREYFSEAAKAHPRLIPVFIHAPEELLRERLLQRGRESVEEVELRLQRTRTFTGLVDHPRLMVIENDGPVEEASMRLFKLIISRGAQTDPRVP